MIDLGACNDEWALHRTRPTMARKKVVAIGLCCLVMRCGCTEGDEKPQQLELDHKGPLSRPVRHAGDLPANKFTERSALNLQDVVL